jgi:multiple sugar transport system ATP-binding protein
MAEVTFDHVTKVFGDVVAVNDLNLGVEDGEFLVLVGPSGCGKSTALRLLAGLEEASSGEIRIGDRVINDVAARDRDIAMVFQTYALYPHMSVFDNMAFGLKIRKLPKAEVRVRVQAGAEMLGIEDLLDRKPRQLSGGQRQRVALGRAIVRDPAVFLLDEPLSNLDAKLRVQTRAEISKLHERLGTTFIYVTHDQTEAMTMATRIAVMENGLLHQVGTPQELYRRPTNTFVAGFIGSPAMNFFDALLEQEEETLRLKVAEFNVEVPTDTAAQLRAQVGREIVFGIRPEHVHAPDYVPTGVRPARVQTAVEVVESMGSETLLHLSANGNALLARVDPRVDVRSGDQFPVVFDLAHMHLFDAATRVAIPLASPEPRGGARTPPI